MMSSITSGVLQLSLLIIRTCGVLKRENVLRVHLVEFGCCRVIKSSYLFVNLDCCVVVAIWSFPGVTKKSWSEVIDSKSALVITVADSNRSFIVIYLILLFDRWGLLSQTIIVGGC